MASETDIINAALRIIAGNRITSLSQGNKNANVASDLYQVVRDDMLASHNWNFATKRAELARSSTTPAFEFDYGYAVPSDWMRTVSVHDNDGGFGTVEHKEENIGDQRCILASVENLYLRYVAKVTDPNLMPADFRKALAYALAADMASPVANSKAAIERLDKMAMSKMLQAKTADARGSSPEKRPAGSWVTSRGGWGTSWNS